MMLIGIEAERANHPKKTGVEHYVKQLILHLAKIDPNNKYRLYLRTKPQSWFFALPKNFEVKVMPFPVFWTQLRISWEMLFRPVDVLFIPASALPLIHPKKSVVTVHDVAWRYFPGSFTWFMKNFLDVSTRFAARHASRIIAVSESTKNDLIKFYEVVDSKVVVVHHGCESVGEDFKSSQNGRVINPPLQQSYVLFLSTLQPRKNLEGLIDAFRLLKQEHPELPHKLVVAGKPGWKYGSVMQKIQDNPDIVIYLNHLEDKQRWHALKAADLLVLPSFYEGFGLPILEAFAAGVPVACSNISSMPEVAGEAAVYFNPTDVRNIASAIKNVLFNKELAASLRERGRERLKIFSWEKCAKETLEVLQYGT